jgi:hypothetical protein
LQSFNNLVTSFITITINREYPDGPPTGDIFRALAATIKKACISIM